MRVQARRPARITHWGVDTLILRIDTKHAAVGLLAFGAAIVGRMLVHSSALEWVGWSFVLVFALLRVRLWIAPPANTNPHGPQK